MVYCEHGSRDLGSFVERDARQARIDETALPSKEGIRKHKRSRQLDPREKYWYVEHMLLIDFHLGQTPPSFHKSNPSIKPKRLCVLSPDNFPFVSLIYLLSFIMMMKIFGLFTFMLLWTHQLAVAEDSSLESSTEINQERKLSPKLRGNDKGKCPAEFADTQHSLVAIKVPLFFH